MTSAGIIRSCRKKLLDIVELKEKLGLEKIHDDFKSRCVSLSFTTRCSVKCSYCYTWRSVPIDMHNSAALKVVDDLPEGYSIIFAGAGEPTERIDDVAAISARGAKKGIKTFLSTNGSASWLKMKRASPTGITFSLDKWHAEYIDPIKVVDSALAATREGVFASFHVVVESKEEAEEIRSIMGGEYLLRVSLLNTKYVPDAVDDGSPIDPRNGVVVLYDGSVCHMCGLALKGGLKPLGNVLDEDLMKIYSKKCGLTDRCPCFQCDAR